MQNICLIKLGGSVITDKTIPYTAKKDVIRRLAREIKKSNIRCIIAHGSGSFGHTSAKKYCKKKGYTSRIGIAKVARDTMEINSIVMDIFLEERLPAISLCPRSIVLAKRGNIQQHNFSIIEEVLSQKLIPVLYGDIVWDTQWKSAIYSSEMLLHAVARYLHKKEYSINKVLYVCDTNGVLDEQQNTIVEITNTNWSTKKNVLYKTTSIDMTGGMRHKVDASLRLTRLGLQTWILNGNTPDKLFTALHDNKEYVTIVKK